MQVLNVLVRGLVMRVHIRVLGLELRHDLLKLLLALVKLIDHFLELDHLIVLLVESCREKLVQIV